MLLTMEAVFVICEKTSTKKEKLLFLGVCCGDVSSSTTMQHSELLAFFLKTILQEIWYSLVQAH